jgi:hypothetical protein
MSSDNLMLSILAMDAYNRGYNSDFGDSALNSVTVCWIVTELSALSPKSITVTVIVAFKKYSSWFMGLKGSTLDHTTLCFPITLNLSGLRSW